MARRQWGRTGRLPAALGGGALRLAVLAGCASAATATAVRPAAGRSSAGDPSAPGIYKPLTERRLTS